jgi:hypothetical protein
MWDWNALQFVTTINGHEFETDAAYKWDWFEADLILVLIDAVKRHFNVPSVCM